MVLSCSDSRVPPELVFDQGLGDIYVVRQQPFLAFAFKVDMLNRLGFCLWPVCASGLSEPRQYPNRQAEGLRRLRQTRTSLPVSSSVRGRYLRWPASAAV